jgi:hypothetical protein
MRTNLNSDSFFPQSTMEQLLDRLERLHLARQNKRPNVVCDAWQLLADEDARTVRTSVFRWASILYE